MEGKRTTDFSVLKGCNFDERFKTQRIIAFKASAFDKCLLLHVSPAANIAKKLMMHIARQFIHQTCPCRYRIHSLTKGSKNITEKELKHFSIKISNAPRAIMECLYLVPDEQDLVECFHFMEGMNNVRPTLVQGLLEKCESIKVKRLFLYLAEKVNHDWFSRLELEKIDLGKGKRSVIKNGVYNSKYQITVSKELKENDQRRI